MEGTAAIGGRRQEGRKNEETRKAEWSGPWAKVNFRRKRWRARPNRHGGRRPERFVHRRAALVPARATSSLPARPAAPRRALLVMDGRARTPARALSMGVVFVPDGGFALWSVGGGGLRVRGGGKGASPACVGIVPQKTRRQWPWARRPAYLTLSHPHCRCGYHHVQSDGAQTLLLADGRHACLGKKAFKAGLRPFPRHATFAVHSSADAPAQDGVRQAGGRMWDDFACLCAPGRPLAEVVAVNSPSLRPRLGRYLHTVDPQRRGHKSHS